MRRSVLFLFLVITCQGQAEIDSIPAARLEMIPPHSHSIPITDRQKEYIEELVLLIPPPMQTFQSHHATKPFLRVKEIGKRMFNSTIYFSSGILAGSVYALSKAGWFLSKISPWDSTWGRECHLLSKMCGNLAVRSFKKTFTKTADSLLPIGDHPPSHTSWYLNKFHLDQIPTQSQEDAELVLFLERRWLAKNTGFYPGLINWLCPCFDISLQVHPHSTAFYTRDPADKLFHAYKDRMRSWKQTLSHPHSFPLILTRPGNIEPFLPFHLCIAPTDSLEQTLRTFIKEHSALSTPVLVDLTACFPNPHLSRAEWWKEWQHYENLLLSACNQSGFDHRRIICIQRVSDSTRGGIRILPFSFSTKKQISCHHQLLLEWASKFGLAINNIELDRCPDSSFKPKHSQMSTPKKESQEQILADLANYVQTTSLSSPQKNLMLKGVLEPLRGLLHSIPSSRWNEVLLSPTQSSLISLCLSHIRYWLHVVAITDPESDFFTTTSYLEQIHSHFTTLIEIFSPFQFQDFSAIFHSQLTHLPEELKPLTRCGLHSSGMTSLTYIFKSIEQTLKTLPHVLYGENIYFENVYAAERASSSVSIAEATESEWADADLILAQFNPSLKRIGKPIQDYHIEDVADNVRKALACRIKTTPLAVALDCTFDFIHSQQIEALLIEFQEEIKAGSLILISYRSGIKFDLFGMDNYCGAPIYIIHNEDQKWSAFDQLLYDPVLQTDLLSLNWFSLAYSYASTYLEDYRKQIFDNTRSLLSQIPSRLLNDPLAHYRVIPVRDAQANLGFIDIKICGPLHGVRGGVLVGGLLTVDSLTHHHPLFYRPSVGFYHPNLVVLFAKDYTTIRLTLGLDPEQVPILAQSLRTIDQLNGRDLSSYTIREQSIPILTRR